MYINEAKEEKDLILTRYLYFVDDVYISAEISFTMKKEGIKNKGILDEILFWLSELYYSGFNVWEFLFYIYYTYYYINNEHIEQRIIKNYRKYNELIVKEGNEKEKVDLIIDTVKNMTIKSSTNKIYDIIKKFKCYKKYESLFNINVEKDEELEIKNYRLSKKLKERLEMLELDNLLKKKSKKKLLLMINNENIDSELMFDILDKIIKKSIISDEIIIKNKRKKQSPILLKDIYELCNNILNKKKVIFCEEYSNYIKIVKLFGLIYLTKRKLKLNVESELEKKRFIKSTELQIKNFIKTNEESEYLFDTLKEKRKYKIRKCLILKEIKIINMLNVKPLKEKKLINKKKEYIQLKGLWEYFIFCCPVWEERIKEYQIKRNEDYKINYEDCNYNMIDFINEDLYENFYEKYNYELQEQSKEVILQAC